jgi:hypothetical protein
VKADKRHDHNGFVGVVFAEHLPTKPVLHHMLHFGHESPGLLSTRSDEQDQHGFMRAQSEPSYALSIATQPSPRLEHSAEVLAEEK